MELPQHGTRRRLRLPARPLATGLGGLCPQLLLRHQYVEHAEEYAPSSSRGR